MSKGAYIGVDIGTGGSRAVSCDLDLNLLDIAYQKHKTIHSKPNQVVQDPEEILIAVKTCLKKVASRKLKIKGIGFSSILPSIVGYNKAGKPTTPLYTWADSQGSKYVNELVENFPHFHQRTGCVPHPMYPAVKLLWVRKEKPQLFKSTEIWGSIKSFVIFNLTGQLWEDKSVASASGFLSTTLKWDIEILNFLGLKRGQLPQLVSATHRTNMNKDVKHLEDVPIYLGAGDGMLAHLATAGLNAKYISSTIGTSGALRVASKKPILDKEEKIWSYNLFNDWWISGGAIHNGGIALEWFRDNFGTEELKGNQVSPYDIFNQYVKATNPGADGLLFLPFLAGERSPNWRPNMRGGFIGLGLGHGKKEMVRAIMEGVICRMRAVMELLKTRLPEDVKIRASGGYSKSIPWLQIQANLLNAPIEVPVEEEAAAKGAVMIAMKEGGDLEDFKDAKIARVIYPDPEQTQIYEDLYQRHVRIYEYLASYYGDSGVDSQ